MTPTDEKIVAAFQFLHDWAKAMGPQKVQTFISTYAPPNFPPQQGPFLTGKVAMMVNGDWMLNQIRTYMPSLNYGVTYIPVANKGDPPSTWAGGWSLCIPTGIQARGRGVQVPELDDGPGRTEGVHQLGRRTCPPGSRCWMTTASSIPQHMFFKDLLAKAYSRPPLSVGALYWDALTTAMNSVTLNQEDPKKALQAVADQVNPQIQ